MPQKNPRSSKEQEEIRQLQEQLGMSRNKLKIVPYLNDLAAAANKKNEEQKAKLEKYANADQETGRIPKPPGQAGRDTNGYALNEALGFGYTPADKAVYNAIRVRTIDAASYFSLTLGLVLCSVIRSRSPGPREEILRAECG